MRREDEGGRHRGLMSSTPTVPVHVETDPVAMNEMLVGLLGMVGLGRPILLQIRGIPA